MAGRKIDDPTYVQTILQQAIQVQSTTVFSPGSVYEHVINATIAMCQELLVTQAQTPINWGQAIINMSAVTAIPSANPVSTSLSDYWIPAATNPEPAGPCEQCQGTKRKWNAEAYQYEVCGCVVRGQK